jgi:hypothetical protein
VSLTPSGLPLRTVITEDDSGVMTSIRLDIPAVNFPLVIEAPPAAQTISVPQLRKLEKRPGAPVSNVLSRVLVSPSSILH